MKTKRFFKIIVSVLLALFMTACGKNGDTEPEIKLSQEAGNIFGSWAYIHDRETAVAVFREDGTAEDEGMKYSFDCDSQFIWLKDAENETIRLRYKPDDDGMYLYKNTIYTYSGEGEPKGLVGQWTCPETNWTFEFTSSGTFLEDGYFPGNYTVDEESKTVKLIYNDQFEDTVCYYRTEGKELYMEYPWRMVKTDTEQGGGSVIVYHVYIKTV